MEDLLHETGSELAEHYGARQLILHVPDGSLMIHHDGPMWRAPKWVRRRSLDQLLVQAGSPETWHLSEPLPEAHMLTITYPERGKATTRNYTFGRQIYLATLDGTLIERMTPEDFAKIERADLTSPYGLAVACARSYLYAKRSDSLPRSLDFTEATRKSA